MKKTIPFAKPAKKILPGTDTSPDNQDRAKSQIKKFVLWNCSCSAVHSDDIQNQKMANHMSFEKYQALIDEICLRTNIPDPASKYQRADLCINGTDFTLFHGGDQAPNSIFIYGDFGALPDKLREQVLLRLLETNMVMFGVNSPSFTYNTGTRHIVLTCRLPLLNADAKALLEKLAGLAEYASQWREGHFLSDEERQAGKSGRSDASTRQSASRSTMQRLALHLSTNSIASA